MTEIKCVVSTSLWTMVLALFVTLFTVCEVVVEIGWFEVRLCKLRNNALAEICGVAVSISFAWQFLDIFSSSLYELYKEVIVSYISFWSACFRLRHYTSLDDYFWYQIPACSNEGLIGLPYYPYKNKTSLFVNLYYLHAIFSFHDWWLIGC